MNVDGFKMTWLMGRASMNAGVQAAPHLFNSSQNLWKKKDE